MDYLQFYRNSQSNINSVIIRSPTLDEICEYGETAFWSLAALICAIPTDYMSELEDAGQRYEDISEYDFFIDELLPSLTSELCNIILPNIHPEKMCYAPVEDSEERIVVDLENQVVIDKNTYIELTRVIRKVFGFKYRPMFAQNDFTRKKLIDIARLKRKKAKTKKEESILLPIVSAMVNCADFKYNHDEVWNMSFFAFMDSVKRVQAVRYANQMYTGGFFGISLKDVKEHLDWMRPL